MPLSRKENRGTEIFVLPSAPLPRRGLLDALISDATPREGTDHLSRRIGSHTFYISYSHRRSRHRAAVNCQCYLWHSRQS